MTKEELEKEAEENSFRYTLDKPWACEVERKQIMAHFEKAYLAGAEPREKRIVELEQKISILLSCKNCPENKGGFICQKEYEGKCLAQKIQYIKELKEENKNLAQNLEDTEICENGWKNRVKELEAQIEKMKKYIKACWVEENLNDYSSYITNNSDEFRDLVHELNEEIRNGR